MSSMANPINALHSLQHALDMNLPLYLHDLDESYKTRCDQSEIGKRFIFARVVDGEAQALAIFGLEDPIGGVECFSVGYAVSEKHRRRGLAIEAVNKGLEFLIREEFSKTATKSFYVEAVIDISNIPSIRFAEKWFSDRGSPVLDGESGMPSLHFKKLFVLP